MTKLKGQETVDQKRCPNKESKQATNQNKDYR